MSSKMISFVETVLAEIREQGLYKQERPLVSPQGPSIHAEGWDDDQDHAQRFIESVIIRKRVGDFRF